MKTHKWDTPYFTGVVIFASNYYTRYFIRSREEFLNTKSICICAQAPASNILHIQLYIEQLPQFRETGFVLWELQILK